MSNCRWCKNGDPKFIDGKWIHINSWGPGGHTPTGWECLDKKGQPASDIKLKLFKVTIPSQTLKKPRRGLYKKLVVGQITDYGFIQGREIIVLGKTQISIHAQCLRELGCKDHEVDMIVEEITGPFEHGYVIAYNQPDGL